MIDEPKAVDPEADRYFIQAGGGTHRKLFHPAGPDAADAGMIPHIVS